MIASSIFNKHIAVQAYIKPCGCTGVLYTCIRENIKLTIMGCNRSCACKHIINKFISLSSLPHMLTFCSRLC